MHSHLIKTIDNSNVNCLGMDISQQYERAESGSFIVRKVGEGAFECFSRSFSFLSFRSSWFIGEAVRHRRPQIGCFVVFCLKMVHWVSSFRNFRKRLSLHQQILPRIRINQRIPKSSKRISPSQKRLPQPLRINGLCSLPFWQASVWRGCSFRTDLAGTRILFQSDNLAQGLTLFGEACIWMIKNVCLPFTYWSEIKES